MVESTSHSLAPGLRVDVDLYVDRPPVGRPFAVRACVSYSPAPSPAPRTPAMDSGSESCSRGRSSPLLRAAQARKRLAYCARQDHGSRAGPPRRGARQHELAGPWMRLSAAAVSRPPAAHCNRKPSLLGCYRDGLYGKDGDMAKRQKSTIGCRGLDNRRPAFLPPVPRAGAPR